MARTTGRCYGVGKGMRGADGSLVETHGVRYSLEPFVLFNFIYCVCKGSNIKSERNHNPRTPGIRQGRKFPFLMWEETPEILPGKTHAVKCMD